MGRFGKYLAYFALLVAGVNVALFLGRDANATSCTQENFTVTDSQGHSFPVSSCEKDGRWLCMAQTPSRAVDVTRLLLTYRGPDVPACVTASSR